MPRKVLIVDDMKTNRLILRELLRPEYDVLEAENGQAALDVMQSEGQSISAVLLDISMPAMDGYEVLHRIRDDPRLSQMPVIMITDSEGEAPRVLSLTQGASDYVTKPYNPEIIRHCLRNHIAFREASETVNALRRDSLTSLYTRESFFDKVIELVAQHESGYYVMASIDIDRFKVINDQYGTEKGDELLRHFAMTFRNGLNPIGGICSRIAADDFAVLYPARLLPTGVLEELRESAVYIEGLAAPVTCSIGRYIVDDTQMPPSGMYDRAVLAAASVKGRYDESVATYDDTMRERLLREQEIVAEMRTALEAGQFEAWYQPQYNHTTGAMIGAEALARWRHPERGLVPPGVFVPIFEQNGFVFELDKFIWEDVCRNLRRWLDEGRNPLPVSVNISRIDLFRTDLLEHITGLVAGYGLPVELLRLEITESAFANDAEKIISVVKELIARGFTVEIDDFGSGYSSLNTLKDVPAQVLKLDMRFFERGNDTQRGGNIISSVVRMAKWLGMSVIAEGVEERAQADFLRSVGCSYIQGYLYARPMPADEYERFCRGNAKEERLIALETVQNLNNNSFWDPRSMDTLIFNSYVGGACIFEYHEGAVELLRVNKKFTEELGGESMSEEAALGFNFAEHMDGHDLVAVRNCVRSAIDTGEESACEICVSGVRDYETDTYLRMTVRAIARAGERVLCYCTVQNTTRRTMAELDLLENDEQIRFLNEVSHDLLAQPDTDVGIKALLSKLMDYFQGTRAYIFELDARRDTSSNTYEVCAEGVTSELDNLQELPNSVIDTWFRAFRESGFIAVEDVALLDEHRAGEKAVLESQGITSMAAAPVFRDGGLIGFIGVDDPQRRVTQVGRLMALGDYVAVMLTRRDLDARIARDNRTLSDMMSDMPGGFAKLRLSADGSSCYEYANNGFCNMLGITPGEVTELFSGGVMSRVHPDDMEELSAEANRAIADGSILNAQYRLRHKNGGYVWVQIFARPVKAENGDMVVYCYYVDLSAEQQNELMLKSAVPHILSAIMQNSTNLDFAKDRDFNYICCSPAFAEFAHRESADELVGKNDFELFPRETAEQFRRDDMRLFESGESLVDFTEPIPSDDDVQHYALTSKYILRDSAGEIIGLYGTGRDVTDTRAAYDQLKLLTDSIPGGISVYSGRLDAMDRIQLSYFSDGFCQLFGYTREEYEKLAAVNPLGLVFSSDLDALYEKVVALVLDGVPMDYIYRAHTRDGSYKWINVKAVRGVPSGDNLTVNAVFFDVTELRDTLEKLRMSEEESRLAIEQGGRTISRFDIQSRTLRLPENTPGRYKLEHVLHNVPEKQIALGEISPETAHTYRALYNEMIAGKRAGSGVFQRRSTDGWRWLEAKYSTIFASDGTPVKAVVSFTDVTEQRDKESVYLKWKGSLSQRGEDSYTLFRCNLSKMNAYDSREGQMLPEEDGDAEQSFNERTEHFAARHVFIEDRERFRAFANSDTMLAEYYRGHRIDQLDFRWQVASDRLRWLRLSVELVEYPDSKEIEAFMLFEDIDDEKRAELKTLERAETDSLTNLLNRTTVVARVDQILASSAHGTTHALLMLDIDCFKRVNDVFGHEAGDKLLIDIAKGLRSMVRESDLVGRLGGDEFVVFLTGIADERAAVAKARQICTVTRKSLSMEVQVSSSVGIVIAPRDGSSFEELYKRVDSALYYVKGTGKDNIALYNESMADRHSLPAADTADADRGRTSVKKQLMLIVDDSSTDNAMLQNMFADQFFIEKARDGKTALVRLKHYGSAVSVVLLDLIMPGMDGFEVLQKMRENEKLSGIPVVVVSGDESREACLKAIRCGATDFVTKPVDPDILRIRVRSAISRAENERLRAKNALLEVRSEERIRYEYVLERVGITFIEYDWLTKEFIYYPSVSRYLAGTYDSRPLWQILLSDMVADTAAVQSLQRLIHRLAISREEMGGTVHASLKTPGGETHSFRINVHKQVNDFQLTNKFLITLTDLDYEAE